MAEKKHDDCFISFNNAHKGATNCLKNKITHHDIRLTIDSWRNKLKNNNKAAKTEFNITNGMRKYLHKLKIIYLTIFMPCLLFD